MHRRTFTALLAAAAFVPRGSLGAEVLPTGSGEARVARMAEGLDTPWALAFLPGGAMLVTERDSGRLLLIEDGRARAVRGVPRVENSGQGGLLDVVAARDFATSREIFLTYSEPRPEGAGTALAVARLADGPALADLRVIFRQVSPSRGGRHFGSRVVEAPDGTLFVTVGDRGARAEAQSLQSHKGKLLRIARDGRAPSGNPFMGRQGALDTIWSYGHRNAQGAALDGQGRLWTVEHGARGGDEINRPEPGRNYGWPVISYGREYSGGRIGQGTDAPGMEQPRFYWDPSIAPSGMAIYSGRLWPDWRGHIFVGSLKFDMISRLSAAGGGLAERARLFEGRYARIRDIREAPDGALWFIAESDGALYRMTPAAPA